MTKKTTLNIQDVIPNGRVVQQIVKDVAAKNGLSESFVIQTRPAPQVTEFVNQKTKDAHDELYRGYVETYNRVSNELDSADRSKANSQHSTFRSLKYDETQNLNAAWLHELYFENCFDPNSTIYMNSISFLKLQDAFGSFDDWQHDFMACAASCGQGWAVCGYHMYLRQYVNTIVTGHAQDVMIGMLPVVVLDMHEHARRDYLNDKKSYIVAMMTQINWDVVNRRIDRSEKIAGALKT